MNFSLDFFLILSHPVTSKQPHKIIQILMGHLVSIAVIFFFFKILQNLINVELLVRLQGLEKSPKLVGSMFIPD